MIPMCTKFCLLLAATLGAVSFSVAAARTPTAPSTAAPTPSDTGQRGLPGAPPHAVSKLGFQEVTVAIKPSGLSNRLPETIRVSADGTCLYVTPGRPARGGIPAWTGARIVHKLPPDRLRELNALLQETDWLARDTKEVLQLHHPEYTITLRRDDKTTRRAVKGKSETFGKLLYFFQSVAAQEYLLYRLTWVPAVMAEARYELDCLVAAELGEPFARSPLAIDLKRYAPWARRLVRKPFGQSADDVRTAVRLVGLLRLESEREYLADLAADRDRNVRVAVARAIVRLGGEKAIPVLRKMVRSTGLEAAWELIRQGKAAVPVIAKVIREGKDPEEDLSYEWLIRAYIEHWKEVPKPLDPTIVEAVRANMVVPTVKADRVQYHAELLKLAAGVGRKE